VSILKETGDSDDLVHLSLCALQIQTTTLKPKLCALYTRFYGYDIRDVIVSFNVVFLFPLYLCKMNDLEGHINCYKPF